MEKNRKSMIGSVLTNKMAKTVIVAVESIHHHPVYKKTFKRVVRYKVHDEKSVSKPGDTVRIEGTRPLSKEKRWRVAEVVVKKELPQVKPEEIV
jgi:small subunit ribosomal protein S17